MGLSTPVAAAPDPALRAPPSADPASAAGRALAPPANALGGSILPPAKGERSGGGSGGAPSGSAEPAARGLGNQIRAQLRARLSTLIASPMSGRINELTLRDGDRFKLGQRLAQYDCAIEESQLARVRANLTKKQATLDANEKLLQLRSSSTLEVAVARAEVAEAHAEVRLGQTRVDHCSLVAPFAGKVADRVARPHQFVREGDPILEILDDSQLEVEFLVPSRWLMWLKPGQGFQIEVDETGGSHAGMVDRLSGHVDPVSQTIKIYGHILDLAPPLLPGMSGTIQIAHPPEAGVPAPPPSPSSSSAPAPPSTSRP
jgi:RND family efflux transporter MFP subunit